MTKLSEDLSDLILKVRKTAEEDRPALLDEALRLGAAYEAAGERPPHVLRNITEELRDAEIESRFDNMPL
jgi:hypothetical protein